MIPATQKIRSASILLPTWQGMEFLDRVLDALKIQDCSLPFDLLVVDSDSSDGTVERLRERAAEMPFPSAVLRVRSREFDHGDTRNLLASRSTGDLLVYLTQDAIPSHRSWLTKLIENFDDPLVGAVSCGNVPRNDASLSARVFCRDDPGYGLETTRTVMPAGPALDALSPDDRRALLNFQNVASAVRRGLWERYPFPRTMMGEDVLMARGVLEAGYATVYDSVATVDHSHDYGPEKLRWRGQVDARFNAEWLDRICVREQVDVDVLVERMMTTDMAAAAAIHPQVSTDDTEKQRVENELRELRRAFVRGLYEGGLSAKRYARSGMRESGRLRLLLVTDSPSNVSPLGSQYAFRLGRELLDRGHEVLIAHFESELGGRQSLPGQTLGVRTVRCGGQRAVEELMESFAPDVTHAIACTRAPIRTLSQAVASHRPTLLSLLSSRAAPAKNSDLHELFQSVDRVIVPTQRMVSALEGGMLDQHRLELSAPGLFASLPHRQKGTAAADPGARVVIAGQAQGGTAAIESALAAEFHVVALKSQERIGPDAADRLEICAEASCAVILGAEDDVDALWYAMEAREAGLPCVVPEGSAAAELQWHDPDVITAAPDPASLCAAVRRLAARPKSRRSHDVPLKTIADDARDMEYRYRTLASVDRADPNAHWEVLSASGAALDPLGESVEQGGGQRVLFPGSEASTSLADVCGTVTVNVTRSTLANEELWFGGSVWIDSRRIGVLPAQAPAPDDQRTTDSFQVTVPKGAARLRFVAHGSEWSNKIERLYHLRIAEVSIQRSGIATPGSALGMGASPPSEATDTAAPTLLERCRSLEVAPVSPLAPEELPTVALIIPTLDGRELLHDCLRSLQDVHYPHAKLTICVVDNGSEDGTADWVTSGYPKVKVVRLDRNHGFASACNLGVERTAVEDIVAFVNNDMRFDPRFLMELVSPLARGVCDATTARRMSWDGKTLDGAGVGSTFVGIAVQPGFQQPLAPADEIRRRTLFPCGGAMAMTRASFEDLGGFDEDFFAYYEDLDLGWRAWVAGYDVHYVPTAVCEHHHSHTSKRFAPETVRRMVIRNSLLTCIKNYDDENFAKILPAMTALAVERAFLRSDLDLTRFEPAGQESSGKRRIAANGATVEPAGTVNISSIGAADLVALHDVFGRWDEVLQKRAQVQALRRREDHELFPMFLEPLACVEGDPSYQALQRGLVRWLGLGSTFGQAQP